MSVRDNRQIVVQNWVNDAFGLEQARSIEYRALRFFEEAVELAQATGASQKMLERILDYVYSRPPGAVRQELGGVGLTLLALASAIGVSADGAEQDELARVLAKPIEHFTRRNEEKNGLGFIPEGWKK
jgi:NTP pyrophosphatase (non-canonical NTP hydrolase)